MDHERLFGPVGLLANNVDKLQDAFDGIDSGDAVIWPGRVVEVQDVPTLVSLQEETELRCWGPSGGGRWKHSLDSRIPA